MTGAAAYVHPKAHVDGATLGAGTRVWQFASVIRGARLGADCTVAAAATLDGCSLGDRVIVCPGVFCVPGVLVGDDVFIGPNVTFCNDAWPAVGKDGFDLKRLQQGEWTIILKDGAAIGANAVVLPGVVIGEGAMVAAGAVVRADVPANQLLKRDGSLSEITAAMRANRMRPCFTS